MYPYSSNASNKSNFCCAKEKLFTSGTVQDLIDVLELIDDKSLPIRVIEQGREDEGIDNFWLCDIEVSSTGASGYEQSGEVRLIGGE